MNIDFTKPKLCLVITLLDMRLEFNRLTEIALVYLHINVKKAELWSLSFPKKKRKITKNIWHDHK